jgi:hypothetical protein
MNGFFNSTFFFMLGTIMGHLGGSSYFIYLKSINYDPFNIIVKYCIIGGVVMYSIGRFSKLIKRD